MNICVCGYYGYGNFGDDLFLKTFQQIFAEDTVFPWIPCVDANRIDAVIIGGGDLIFLYTFYENYFPAALIDYPTWIHGVGIVDTNDVSTRKIEVIEKNRGRISKAKKLSLRDPYSARLAEDLQFNKNIETVPDIVFAYREPKYPVRKFSAAPSIGICLTVHDDFSQEKMLALFCNLAAQGYHLVFIPVVNMNNPYSDMPKAEFLRNKILEIMPNAGTTLLTPYFDLEMIYSYIQAVDFLISFKLHPVIAAVRNSVPVFCFSELTKVSTLYKTLGLDYYANDFDLPMEEIKLKIDTFLAEGKTKFASITDKIRLLEEESQRSLIRLKNEIKGIK